MAAGLGPMLVDPSQRGRHRREDLVGIAQARHERDARDHGTETIFLVDDNITLDVRRFEALCRAIIEAGLNDLDYTVQAMTSAIANHGKTLAPLMRRAGFRYVFLGIENILEEDLEFLRAEAKNRQRGEGAGNAAAGTSAGFTIVAGVLDRLVFYNQSAYDGNDAGANAADDSAIAGDKVAYLGGSAAAGGPGG